MRPPEGARQFFPDRFPRVEGQIPVVGSLLSWSQNVGPLFGYRSRDAKPGIVGLAVAPGVGIAVGLAVGLAVGVSVGVAVGLPVVGLPVGRAYVGTNFVHKNHPKVNQKNSSKMHQVIISPSEFEVRFPAAVRAVG